MEGKLLVLITGANQGLGYYAAQQMAATGKYHVLLGSRDPVKGADAVKKLTTEGGVPAEHISPIKIDVDSDDSIVAAAKEVEDKYGYLDILMLNAGIIRAEGSIREQWTKIYNTNVFSLPIAIDAFLPLMQKSTAPGGKRIAITTSNFGSLEMTSNIPQISPKDTAFVNIYRSSKTAINMVIVIYTKMLEGDGFIVSGSSPGYCATNMNGYIGYKEPAEGAKVLVEAVVGPKEEVHGRVINEDGVEPW